MQDPETFDGVPLRQVFPSILLPVFLAVVDGTIVAAALPSMAAAFGEVERVSWVIASYLVASTVAAPVYGRLGDAWGRRRLLLAALVLFMLASLLCASAQGIVSLAAARALQGFGGGGLMVLSQALLGENVPRRQLGRAQGLFAAVIVVSSTFGPVAGGALTQLFGWPSVFLVNLPLGVLAIVLALRLPSRRRGGGRTSFDGPGLLLFAGLVVPLLLALEQVRHATAATLPGVAAALGLSLLCSVLLLRQERRATQPVVPAADSATSRHVACQRDGGLFRRPAGQRGDPAAHPSAGGGRRLGRRHRSAHAAADRDGRDRLFVTGRLVSRTGRLAIFPSIGQSAAALGLVLVAFGSAHVGAVLGPWGLPGMLAVVAVFQGSAMPVAQVTAQLLAPPPMLGAAAASVQLSRSIGSAAGVTIVTSILFMVLRGDHGPAAAFADAVHHGPAVFGALPGGVRAAVAARIEDGFTSAFLVVATFAAMNAALAWTLPLRRL